MTSEITNNYYLAGLIEYCGRYPLVEVRTQDRDTTFVFQINPWSLDELQEAYDSPEGQPITDVKKYAGALQKLTALQKKARQNPDGLWTSRSWILGLKGEADELDCGTWAA